MPFLAQEHLPIPTRDILSWCYDNRHAYDQDKPIYVDAAHPERSISAKQAYKLIRRLIAGFRAAGLKKGDCVCIHAFNNLYYPILVQGIIGFGGVFVGTNPSYTAYELHHALKTSKAKMILVEPDLIGAIKQPAEDLGIHWRRILFLQAQNGQQMYQYYSWRHLLDHGEKDWVRFDDLETARNTTAFLMFSSGTTGLPKAAQLSHYNLIAEHTLVHENPKHLEQYDVSRIMSLPLFHAAAAPYVHVSSLRSGMPAFLMKRFALPDYLNYIQSFKVTSLMMVPPMVTAVVNVAASSPENEAMVKQCLRSVRAVVGGAAPLDAEMQGRMQALLPQGSPFTQLWAMTETSCVASYFYHPEDNDTASVGRFMPNLDVKVVDADTGETEVPQGQRGELCIRGPTVIRGYLDNPEANARDWDGEGYFHTGDIVYCDPETKLWYVVDRKKELIKVRGFQVAPAELEGCLLSHPSIRDVAVIGIPSGDSELPRAYIIRGEGVKLRENEVHNWVNERLARFKRLEGGVRFVDSIPKTASGKILKRVMREEVKREMGAKL